MKLHNVWTEIRKQEGLKSSFLFKVGKTTYSSTNLHKTAEQTEVNRHVQNNTAPNCDNIMQTVAVVLNMTATEYSDFFLDFIR